MTVTAAHGTRPHGVAPVTVRCDHVRARCGLPPAGAAAVKVVYSSFDGWYSDSPRAVFEALLRRGGGHEHVWVQDPAHADGFPDPLPAGVRTVPARSPEAGEALGSADVVVANSHTSVDAWTKRPGTVYVQTWHGTPLKRIHRDAIDTEPAVMDRIDEEIARWDHLVTPGGVGTELLRSAFRFRGEVLETGYPRNDVLTGPDAAAVRERVRRQLGIDEGATAVLYAPTWRDDQRDDPALAGRAVPLGLDVDALADRLGPQACLLLRLHYFVSDRGPGTVGDTVRDVSSYPDIAELYLAADVLVTDYSSVMFDFVATGKPVLLFAYDLEDYRDRLRGFYLDLEVEAPGPVLRTQDELAVALADLPHVVESSTDRYARFRQRYCPLDDGHATERVLDRIWPR